MSCIRLSVAVETAETSMVVELHYIRSLSMVVELYHARSLSMVVELHLDERRCRNSRNERCRSEVVNERIENLKHLFPPRHIQSYSQLKQAGVMLNIIFFPALAVEVLQISP